MNVSGSITTGGIAQTVFTAANSIAGFVGYTIQNNSSGDLWVNDDSAAATLAAPSIKIQPGALYESPSNKQVIGAVSIIGATTGQVFTATRF